MLNYFRRTAQVAVLTCVLIFGTLLMLGSFGTTGWSDSHHGFETSNETHETVIFFFYIGEHTHQEYYENGGHGNTNH